MSFSRQVAYRGCAEASAQPLETSDGTTGPPAPAETSAAMPLRAVHTPNFPALLRQLGASLLVTTSQAGKLVLVCDEGDHLNTHFRTFQAPMDLAFDGGRLAIGTGIQVWKYAHRRNRPDRPVCVPG